MKRLVVKEELHNSQKGGHLYYEECHGTLVHDVVVDAGIGDEVVIGHLSDLHYNYCNKQDFLEADPVIMSTHWHRLWLGGGRSVSVGRCCFDVLDDADQMVFNGDTLDYLSHGSMELMQMEVWDRFPDAIATVGGHELSRCMQGKVADTMTYAERMEKIKAFWKHDVYYTSRLLKDKVLVVGMCNNMWTFNAYQHECLKKDIALAREKGYVVLLFMHEPICTGDPAYEHVTTESPCVLQVGDASGFPKDFYRGNTRGNPMVGSERCDETTNAVYAEIVNNADVIRGVFAGHWHSELALDIVAKNGDGTPATIPQYVKTASAYGDGGSLMRILVK